MAVLHPLNLGVGPETVLDGAGAAKRGDKNEYGHRCES